MCFNRPSMEKKNVKCFIDFIYKSFHQFHFLKNKKNEKGEKQFVQLRHSDSNSEFDKNGIMKITNWPKKKDSKNKNELYLLRKGKEENGKEKQINFKELNIKITKKINDMQNLNEIYKYIYYNKDILMPINYVVCIYKMYKLVKRNNFKIRNYEKEINKKYINADVERILHLSSLMDTDDDQSLGYRDYYPNEQDSVADVDADAHDLKKHISSVITRESLHTTKGIPKKYFQLNKNSCSPFILNYENEILQYVLTKLKKTYFVTKLTYRHISNLLFALANLKYYNLSTFLFYAKYINNNIYLYFTSQSIANIAYAYSTVLNFYCIDFTKLYQPNSFYKYYLFDDKIKEDIQKDHLNFMFLLLSRIMCFYIFKHFNNICNTSYDMSRFYEEGNGLSSFKELNEKERKSKIFEKRKYESKQLLKELFVFLWSLSKMKISNIYIDVSYYILYKNRKHIYFKINEKDASNLIHSLCVYYPLHVRRRTHMKVFLEKGENQALLDYNVFLKNALLLSFLHLKKGTCQYNSIILKSIKTLQNYVVPLSVHPSVEIDTKSVENTEPNMLAVNTTQMKTPQKHNEEGMYCNQTGINKYETDKNNRIAYIFLIQLQNILKKLTTVVTGNLFKIVQKHNFVDSNIASLDLQHMSTFLYCLSHLSDFLINKELKEKVTNHIISQIETQAHGFFDINKQQYDNLNDCWDSSFLERSYDNMVSLSNINYALNKMNIINETIILYSSFYLYKLYGIFYKLSQYSSSQYFLKFLNKMNERILSISNWTISHSGISFIPLLSLVTYNYLYIIYKETCLKKIVQLLKKVLLPITLFNHITINQLRLILKLLIHFYVEEVYIKRENKTQELVEAFNSSFSGPFLGSLSSSLSSSLSNSLSDSFLSSFSETEEDLLNCLYSLSLIVTNILHNFQMTQVEDENEDANVNTYTYRDYNAATDVAKKEFRELSNKTSQWQQNRAYVFFYTDLTTSLLVQFFSKLYCETKNVTSKNQTTIFNSSNTNTEVIMKLYTLYLFIKCNMKRNKVCNKKKYIKKFLNPDFVSSKELEEEEKILSLFCNQKSQTEWKNQLFSSNQETNYTNELTKDSDKINNRKGDKQQYSHKNKKNRLFVHQHVNTIYNKNFEPQKNMTKIFYLFQQNIHLNELRYNKNIFCFLRNAGRPINLSNIKEDIQNIEKRISQNFRNVTSSISHLKLTQYIKGVVENKYKEKKRRKEQEGGKLLVKADTDVDSDGDADIDVQKEREMKGKEKDDHQFNEKIVNEYIINRNGILFVVDIYDQIHNIIFEVNGMSHFTKQFWLHKKQINKENASKNDCGLYFQYYYNYKCYYIFKHTFLSTFCQVVHLPLHNTKLCKQIIQHCYKNNKDKKYLC